MPKSRKRPKLVTRLFQEEQHRQQAHLKGRQSKGWRPKENFFEDWLLFGPVLSTKEEYAAYALGRNPPTLSDADRYLLRQYELAARYDLTPLFFTGRRGRS
jgi:hypothetical protein